MRRCAPFAVVAWAVASMLAGAGGAGAQEPGVRASPHEIEEYLESARAELGVPGLAFVLVKDGAPVLTLALGVADGAGTPVTPQTPFMLASVSKAFTALAVMQLVEAGVLDLDEPVRTYLPWFELADPGAAARITLRHLLHHTSGLSEASGVAYHGSDDQDPEALERGVRRLASESLEAEPGETFIYSNTNYDILGLVVQATTGRPFGEVIETGIFGPLGMDHSHADVEEARADGLSEGFYPWFGSDWRPHRVPLPRTGTPSATMFSSAEDMGAWIGALLAGGRTEDGQVLSAAGVEALMAPGVATDEFHGYGMGWFTRPYWEALDPTAPAGSAYTLPSLVEHDGAWTNARTYVHLVPSQGAGYALLLNGVDPATPSRFDSINQSLLRLLVGRDALPPVAYEDWLSQNARLVVVVLLAAELVSLAWSVVLLARLGRGVRPGHPRRSITGLVLAAALDLAILWLVVLFVPDAYGHPLDRLFQYLPDIGLGALLLVGLAAIWGPARTILAIVLWRRPGRQPAPGVPATA